MTAQPDSMTARLPGKRRAGGLNPKGLAALLALLATVMAGSVIACTRPRSSGEEQTASYSQATVSRQTISSTLEVSGAVSADRQVKLSFPTAGRIATVSVRQGDVVADVVGEACNAVVQHPGGSVVGFRVPVQPTPAAITAACDQRLDQPATDSLATAGRFDPQILEIAQHSRAEGVRMKHEVREPDQRAAR